MRLNYKRLPRLTDLVEGIGMTPELVAQLAALALMQAHIVVDEIHDIVIPLLSPAKRSFAARIARRLERGPVIEEDLLHDLEEFSSQVARQIESGTEVYWQGDDNHVRGGYEAVQRTAEARRLAAAADELSLLRDMILATISAARAVRETGALLDE